MPCCLVANMQLTHMQIERTERLVRYGSNKIDLLSTMDNKYIYRLDNGLFEYLQSCSSDPL